MHVHDRVVVHVDHPGLRRDLPGDLVHVPGGGDAGADVDDLPYPASPTRNRTARCRNARFARALARASGAQHLADRLPVSGIVVLAAEVGVVHPRRVRRARVDLRAAKPGSIASFPVLRDMAGPSVHPIRQTWKMSITDRAGQQCLLNIELAKAADSSGVILSVYLLRIPCRLRCDGTGIGC